jgi:hypothetical protein
MNLNGALPLTVFVILSVSLIASVDFDKLTISLQFLMPLVVFRGTYEMSGKLVSLPISGKGSFNATYGEWYS